jgi:hypothetical protein
LPETTARPFQRIVANGTDKVNPTAHEADTTRSCHASGDEAAFGADA